MREAPFLCSVQARTILGSLFGYHARSSTSKLVGVINVYEGHGKLMGSAMCTKDRVSWRGAWRTGRGKHPGNSGKAESKRRSNGHY